jgi:hypothetical protein
VGVRSNSALSNGNASESAWNSAEAIRLQIAADTLVGQLGVSGRDPIVWKAAEQCVKAHGERSLDGVRAMCRKIEEMARELSRQRRGEVCL